MILTLDVGNSQIYGALHDGKDFRLQFRKSTKSANSSDEIGLFLREVLRENDFDRKEVKKISICSVVPDLDHSLRKACRVYFDADLFVLQAGVKTKLKIKYHNPLEVGADRIANAIGATHRYPGENLVIADLGTATTICVVTADRDYLGGLIFPGLRISMEALATKTAKLPLVEIVRPESLVARSTVESIQSGLYYGHVAMLKDITARIRSEYFPGQKIRAIGTGGFAGNFKDEGVFDEVIPELVHLGLIRATELNAPIAHHAD